MRSMPRSRRLALCAAAAMIGAAAWTIAGLASRASNADDADGVVVASSVCEAHELRARASMDPHLQVEIPKEFSSPFPTREACLSHAAAEDPATPGPVQPIQFSHKHHAGLYVIDCQYCHSGADRSPVAGMPSVELLM